MTDDPTPEQAPEPRREPAPGGDIAKRWRELGPDEQRLVMMAIDAIQAGEFEPVRSWDRFVEMAIELLPLLSQGSITVDDLHDRALERARTPKRDAGP